MGRPPTGTDPTISVRLPQAALDALGRCVDGDALKSRSDVARTILLEWLRSNQMLPEKAAEG